MNIKDYLEQKRNDVDRFLDAVMPSAATAPNRHTINTLPQNPICRFHRRRFCQLIALTRLHPSAGQSA